MEAWTARSFAAGELVLVPITTEVKDRYWTANRSTYVEGAEKLAQEYGLGRKAVVLDGRLKTAVQDGSGKSFALYWLVISTLADTDDPNMIVGSVTASVDVSLTFPHNASPVKMVKRESPGIPVLYNKHPIDKHTRLVACQDAKVRELSLINTHTMLAQKADEAKSQAKVATGGASSSTHGAKSNADPKVADTSKPIMKPPPQPKATGKTKAKAAPGSEAAAKKSKSKP
jgi:hypothetical protein